MKHLISHPIYSQIVGGVV